MNRDATGICLLVAAAAGCTGGPRGDGHGEPRIKATDVTADLGRARQGRIVFSHHSVGANVLDGIRSLDAAVSGTPLKIASFEEATALDGPVLAQGGGGSNGDPKSKINFFADLIRTRPALKPELAFMKLCYVDFTPSTDVDDLFSYYRRTLEALKKEHPEIRFAHVTVPLFRRPEDVKSSFRRALGLAVWEDAANAKRSDFNQRLIDHFAADPVFDLARVESTDPAGAPTSFAYAGGRYASLHASYTDDGGHLNNLGQRVAATAAIHFLGAALRRPDPVQ